MMVLELTGPKEEFDKGIKYLNECGVKVEPIARSVRRIEEICIHCGACTAVCPTGALYIDRKTMEVIFDTEKCGGCELCVKACPPRAMEVSF
ncbi:MAG: 4Fe-4S binding protein [Deltaproteobacteria bacterium]|nr:4Fe-4S binding protein [Deltaproteobacteria bacterium]